MALILPEARVTRRQTREKVARDWREQRVQPGSKNRKSDLSSVRQNGEGKECLASYVEQITDLLKSIQAQGIVDC